MCPAILQYSFFIYIIISLRIWTFIFLIGCTALCSHLNTQTDRQTFLKLFFGHYQILWCKRIVVLLLWKLSKDLYWSPHLFDVFSQSNIFFFCVSYWLNFNCFNYIDFLSGNLSAQDAIHPSKVSFSPRLFITYTETSPNIR